MFAGLSSASRMPFLSVVLGGARALHRVLGLLRRVQGVLHRVLGVLHRVLGVRHRVLGVLHRVLGLPASATYARVFLWQMVADRQTSRRGGGQPPVPPFLVCIFIVSLTLMQTLLWCQG